MLQNFAASNVLLYPQKCFCNTDIKNNEFAESIIVFL